MRVPDGDGPPQERNTQEHKTEFCAKGVFRSQSARPWFVYFPAVIPFRFITLSPLLLVQIEDFLLRERRSKRRSFS